MPLTVDQLVEEAKHLPRKELAGLVDRLEMQLCELDPAIDAEWQEEIQRRMADIETGRVKTIPGDVVMAKARRLAGL